MHLVVMKVHNPITEHRTVGENVGKWEAVHDKERIPGDGSRIGEYRNRRGVCGRAKEMQLN